MFALAVARAKYGDNYAICNGCYANAGNERRVLLQTSHRAIPPVAHRYNITLSIVINIECNCECGTRTVTGTGNREAG